MGNAQDKVGLDNWLFNVIEVKPNSPAERCGLKVDEDFIVSVDGADLKSIGIEEMKKIVQAAEDAPVKLVVYHRHRKDYRDVTIVPTRNWPGTGLIGLIARMENMLEYSDENPFRSFNEAVNDTQCPILWQMSENEQAPATVDLLGLDEYDVQAAVYLGKSSDSADTTTVATQDSHSKTASPSSLLDVFVDQSQPATVGVDVGRTCSEDTSVVGRTHSADTTAAVARSRSEDVAHKATAASSAGIAISGAAKSGSRKSHLMNDKMAKQKQEAQCMKKSSSASASSTIFHLGRSLSRKLSFSSKPLKKQLQEED